MKWLIWLIIFIGIAVRAHEIVFDTQNAETAFAKFQHSVKLASDAASMMVDPASVSDGQPVFVPSTADTEFRTILAKNMNLDPTSLQANTGTWFQGAVAIDLEQFVDYSNATFPYHYINQAYNIDTVLNGPSIIYVVHVPTPTAYGTSPQFDMTWKVVAAYKPPR